MRSRVKLVYAFLALLLLAACQSADASQASNVSGITHAADVPRMRVKELKALLDAGQEVIIADSRSWDYFEASHIAGAISMPFLEVGERYDELPKNAKIVLYCTWPAEQTSAGAALKLYQHGFTDVHALVGGLGGWQAAGNPVETKE